MPTTHPYDQVQLHELLYQALETELGGIRIYETAISCAINHDLREEWQEYLDHTHSHHDELLRVFESLGLDPETRTTCRDVVGHIAESLVMAMQLAQAGGDPYAAQLVAGECVILAETKDHMNWELIGHLAIHGKGPETQVLREAYDAVEQEEDHHLYHSTGWTRELWLQALGLPAVLPPPEEVKKVASAIAAARAEQSRDQLL
jgi:hypothetical protein